MKAAADTSKVSLRNNSLEFFLAIRQLSTMLASGMPLVRGLEALSSQPDNEQVSAIFAQVTRRVESGHMLSEACAQFPRVFSSVFLSMVQVGEATGQLVPCLDQLTVMLEREYSVQRRIRSAFAYPIFVIAVAALLVLLNNL